jgi:cytochrome P450
MTPSTVLLKRKQGRADMGDVTAGARAPGVHGAPLRGVLPALARSPIDFLGGAWREHGDVVRLRLGSGPLGATGHLLVHPDHVLHVLVERQRDYELSTAYEVLRSVLGRGLLTSHAETWRTRRRLLQRAFAPARLERIAPLVALAAETGTERLLRAADGDQPIDLYAAMAGITYDAVGRSLFGVDVSASTPTSPRPSPARRSSPWPPSTPRSARCSASGSAGCRHRLPRATAPTYATWQPSPTT